MNSIQGNSEEFEFINTLFNNFIKDIHEYMGLYNGQISIQIQEFIDNFNFASKNSINSLNQIKDSLIEGKKKVMKARNDYYKYIKTNKNLESGKKYNKELFKANKGSLAQTYRYEINQMNEIITQSNQKYIDIFKNLQSINLGANFIIKNIFNKFIKSIADIGNIFIKFSEQLNENFEMNMNNINDKINYGPKMDEESEMRFNFEKFEEYDDKKVILKDGKIILIGESDDNLSLSLKLQKSSSLLMKSFESFEIIQSPMDIMDQKKIQEKTIELDNFIKKFPTKNELSAFEISNLINILKEETFDDEKTFSYIFLKNLQNFLKNKVKRFTNRQNFIHLSNIMNTICCKEEEDKTNTFNAIIQVSQMIKYENLFLYSMIQRKNHLFSTKAFWLSIIQKNLINNINNYADQLIQKNIKNEIKLKKEKSKEIDKKIEKKDSKENTNILFKIGFDKYIYNYNKLDEEKKALLNQYAYENICLILSKSIPGMCSFLVPEYISIDIIKHYSKLFDFKRKTISYFFNILEAKNIKNSLGQKKTSENSIKKKIQCDKLFIISSTLKYLERKDFCNLLHLSKNSSPFIKKKIFKLLLSNKNMTIEKRIKIWEIILKIKEQKKIINYKEIKKNLKERLEKGEIKPNSVEAKNIHIIDVDLLRTQYINEDISNAEKIGCILKCLNWVKPDIGYCQGMNFTCLFFYQLLDYDEEKTFYFLFALETETEYGKILMDNFKALKDYYSVLDKIIYLYKPELYYLFVDSYVNANLYSTSWFITLFTNIICVFEKKETPKYLLMVLEDFIIDGISAIFVSGFTIISCHTKQILKLEQEELMRFVTNNSHCQSIFKNENFEKIKKYYEICSEIINESLINKLIKITNYENENPYLK